MAPYKYIFDSCVRVRYLYSSSMFSLCGYCYGQFLLPSVACCFQDYPIIPTNPARPLPDPLHCSHPTSRWLLWVCNHSRLFAPQRCLSLDCTWWYKACWLCRETSRVKKNTISSNYDKQKYIFKESRAEEPEESWLNESLAILRVASCFVIWDKLQRYGPLGLIPSSPFLNFVGEGRGERDNLANLRTTYSPH